MIILGLDFCGISWLKPVFYLKIDLMRMLFFVSLLFFHQSSLMAETSCTKPNARYEDITCAIGSFDSAEEQLNNVYRDLFQSVSSEDRPKLKQAQLAWIEFREDDTTFAYANSKEEGSLGALISTNHKLDITLERIKQLKGFMEGRTN